MTQQRITLRDVAKAAGVATGTVSMVLNESPLVAEKTKAKVQAVIKELGYVYDRAAGNLRNKRSTIVGVSICDITNPYYADVTAGIQEALEDLGRVLFLGNCSESTDRQLKFIQTLRQYRVEGVLLTPAIGTPTSHTQHMRDWGVPFVQVTRYIPGVESDYVGNDNYLAAILATDHLLGLGHERIAYIGPNRLTSTGRDRFKGFRAAMQMAGLPTPEKWVVESRATREDGFRATAKLFQTNDAPSALLCFNDPVAFGAMLGLRSIGLEPGVDCSVVGMDDVSEAALWRPGLTTISVERGSIGRAAGRLLMARIEEPDRAYEHVVIKPELIVRSSTGSAVVERRRAGMLRNVGTR